MERAAGIGFHVEGLIRPEGPALSAADSDSNSSEPTTKGEWYANGLKFGCTQCGNCCTGPPGAVWFTKEEGKAMATERGMDEASFLKKYAHQIRGHWSLKEVLIDQKYDCVFLDRDSMPGKAVCSIYKSRPVQCRTWPFWPENLTSKRTWEAVKRRTPCPGMGQGKLVAIDKIRIQRDAPLS